MHSRVYNIISKGSELDDYLMEDYEMHEIYTDSMDWCDDNSKEMSKDLDWHFGERDRKFKKYYTITQDDIDFFNNAIKSSVTYNMLRFITTVESVNDWLNSADSTPKKPISNYDLSNLFSSNVLIVVDGCRQNGSYQLSCLEPGMKVIQTFDYHN